MSDFKFWAVGAYVAGKAKPVELKNMPVLWELKTARALVKELEALTGRSFVVLECSVNMKRNKKSARRT